MDGRLQTYWASLFSRMGVSSLSSSNYPRPLFSRTEAVRGTSGSVNRQPDISVFTALLSDKQIVLVTEICRGAVSGLSYPGFLIGRDRRTIYRTSPACSLLRRLVAADFLFLLLFSLLSDLFSIGNPICILRRGNFSGGISGCGRSAA
jgi:hypothetical protein